MDLKKLPFLPLHYFYVLFEKFQKGVFLFLLACVIGAGLWTLSASLWPDFFSLDIVEVSEATVEKVPIQEITHNYRSFDLSLNAYRQFVSFSAGPILPASGMVYAFVLFQIIAWSVLMASASEIKSRWAYLFYFLYAIFLFTSGLINYLIPQEMWLNLGGVHSFSGRAMNLLLVLPPLILGFCFHMNILRWKLPWKLLSFLIWNIALFAFPYAQGAWETLHEVSTHMYGFQVILALLFFFFLGKEPTKILFAAATNRPQRQARIDYRLILGFCIILLVIEFFWLLEYVNFGILEDVKLGFRPIYLIVFSAMLMSFTSQNHFHQVKNIFSSQDSYTFVLLSWSLLILSFMGYQYSLGDPLFSFTIERIAVIFFFSMGLGHTLFVFINHFPLLKQKVNLYYIMANGRGKFEYWVIWTIGIVSVISAAGFENWKSWDLFKHGYYVNAGDQAYIKGSEEEARRMYEFGIGSSRVSPKANYNLASILLQNPYKIGEAVQRYQDASRRIEFPFARINAASLLSINNQNVEARQILSSCRTVNPYVENNLALLFLKSQQADSAIVRFKKSLISNPELAAVHSNLALLYLDNDFIAEAQSFMEAANESSNKSDAALSNHVFFQLKHPELYLSPLIKSGPSEDLFLNYNQTLTKIQAGLDQLENSKIRELLEKSQMQSPDILLLDGIRLFSQDSIKYAMTRVDFMDANYPEYAADANYFMAVGFYEKGVTEMSRLYFDKAAKAGHPKAALHAAQMEIELGHADSADAKLALLSVTEEGLYEEIAKERAMLLLPYVKNEVFISKMVDLDALTFEDQILIGMYADSLNQYITALDAFRKAQQLDSTRIAPYLELGKIYNKYRDELAVSNLEAGLLLTQKEDPVLLLELARAHIFQRQVDKAKEILESLEDKQIEEQEKLLVLGELALAESDTSLAIQHFASLHGKFPLDKRAILYLSSIFKEQGNFEAGNSLITEALENNTENAEYWYYYAHFSKGWNLNEDAGFGALKAIELSYATERKREIEKEFSKEIQLITSQ